jgi:uncharacterized repeat protein (TIGR02543 family)
MEGLMNIASFRQQIAKLCIISLLFCLIPATSVNAQHGVKNQNPMEAQQGGGCLSQPSDKSDECAQAQAIQIQSAQSVFGSPLSFYVNDDTSTAMYYNGIQQFYGGNAEGVFIWVNGAVYGAGYVPAGQTTNAYTWVGNSLSGSGTSGNPWKATTLVDVGNSGLRLQQEIRYVNGESYVTYSWRVSNTTNTSITYTLFHAADLWTDNNDYGYGYYDASTGAIGGYNGSHTFYQYFQPITAASHYFEGYYSDTWQRIGSISGQGLGFNDTYLPNNYIDNSAGLQWNRTLFPNGVDIISDYGVFNTQIGGITCYSLNLTYNLSRGNVIPTPTENCPNGPGYTYNTTVMLKAVAADGYQFTGWEGDASGTSTIANVAITGDVVVTANFQSLQQKPVIVLVHGWHGLQADKDIHDTCFDSAGHLRPPTQITAQSFPIDPNVVAYDFGGFAKNLLNDGWDVWVAHIETDNVSTPLIEDNAFCLKYQLKYLHDNKSIGKVTLIAHSMGGLVSRAYIENNNSKFYQHDVLQLITLGTPHSGTPFGSLICDTNIFRIWKDLASCQFSLTPTGIGKFDSDYSVRNHEVVYDFIGGNKTPFGLGPILYTLGTEGPNDGVVGAQSGVGRLYWPLFSPTELVSVGQGGSRHIINSSHSDLEGFPIRYPMFDFWNMKLYWRTYQLGSWSPSFFESSTADQDTATDSYKCVLHLLDIHTETHKNNPRGICPPEINTASLQPQADMQGLLVDSQSVPTTIQTPVTSGHISSGQQLTQEISIDASGFAEINLFWDSGILGFTLTDPIGTVIDSNYVANHPNEVIYEENTDPASPLFASYHFVSPIPGQYTLNIVAGNVGANGTDYGFAALLDSTRKLEVTTDRSLYSIGSTAIITATLQSGNVGLTGATVQAFMNRPGTVADVVTLNDVGDGIYKGTYTIPNTPGYLSLSVIANGIDNGTAYSRQVNTLLAVSPPTVQLTGTYSGSPIDDDSNGKYEALAVDVGLDVAQAGDYLVSGDLVSGGTLVAHYVGSHTVVSTGINTVTMLFNGDDIRQSAINGPYTLTNLTIADEQNGGLPAIWQAANLWTTAAYNYQELAATCFVLNLATNPPAGGIIIPNPAPNCNGGLQYTSDSEVTLTVASNAGYLFAGWSGDISGSISPAPITVNADRSVIANFTTSQRFTDVPGSYWAWNFIERLYAAGITGGCATNPLRYCPETIVNRAQMAVFLLRGIHGSSYSPPAVGGSTGFSDVSTTYWAAAWIKQLAVEGITGGCGNGNYCPEVPVTRAQMAIFLLRSKHGASYTPPAVGGSTGFGDVQPNYWAAAWIKQLVTEAITAGCGNGNYCPETPVTRAQMAVFLVRTFNLP